MTSSPLQEILIVGLGAVGTICESLVTSCSIYLAEILPSKDGYILQNSGLVNVTIVARR